ncbi:MAG: hypothetical protein HN469_01965 [Candidatus Marinimicrobia bacterium]|nr:hypothetical protein [Candidatus Neomarinimicrobiota bacterium]MBT7043284.1 hypothetical protein [Candidatus Neomarinimicrobiota bacterium]
MSNKTRTLFSFLIYSTCSVFGQVSSAVDTILSIPEDNSIQCSHSFLIESSLFIFQDGLPVPVKYIDPILGRIILDKKIINPPIIIKYDYLSNGLPLKIGPKWKMLPKLDFSKKSESKSIVSVNKKSRNDESNIFTSGHISRQLSITPLGGSDFSGGLQMQLNGKLSEDIQVSGVLTDQALPIQPEGVTRELEDLDKVYFSVTHSKFNINAGDILYKHNNINRKLVGIKNNFNTNNWSGSSVYGGSTGAYSSIEIMGRDGDQGPYQLVGKNGNSDIIVLSGTEKVWVDGHVLIRGLNHDYTIDYSSGEIHFTPKNLIHSASRIFIEYEYSDFQYQNSFTGGSLTKGLGKIGRLNFGFYRESDQFQKSNWDQNIIDSLSAISATELKTSTAIFDSQGDYVLVGSIFIYDLSKSENLNDRYSIAFEFDPDGNYQRQISNKGQIYYEYFEKSSEQSFRIDSYSPYRTIYAPKSQSYSFIGSDVKIGKHVSLKTNISGSGFYRNVLNQSLEKENGFSRRFDVTIDSVEIGPGRWTLSVSDWDKGETYKALGREIDILQTRNWNLDSTIHNGVRESHIKTKYSMIDIGETDFDLSRLIMGGIQRERTEFTQKISYPLFNRSFIKINSVKKERSIFKRMEGRAETHFFKMSPFLSYLVEEESEQSRFKYSGVGFNFNRDNKKIESGVNWRNDDFWDNDSSWKKESQDMIGFLNYSFKSKTGWKQDVIFQKRIKSFNNNLNSFDYSLAQINISFWKPLNPIRWETRYKIEESHSEERAIVYDSIGTGLGQYRYDPIFNTYVSDPNGAYISYTVPTGNRNPNTVLGGIQSFELDLGKINDFPNVLIRGNLRFDFRGTKSTLSNVINPTLLDSTISRSFLDSRLDLIYNGDKRLMVWIENRHSLNGLDPRGNDLDHLTKIGFDISQSVTKSLLITNQLTFREMDVESSISSLRNREIKGTWNETKLQFRFNSFMDLDFGIIGGVDEGIQQGNSFQANALGFKMDGRAFLNKMGRFQTGISWVKASENNDAEFLPPEALNGFPIGSSFRSNTRVQYFLNQSVSMIFSMTTIHDDRYDNFVIFQGEIRANF